MSAQRIAVVSLHTTGPQLNEDTIFHIGIVELYPGQSMRRHEWCCDPVGHLPRSASVRSGLKAADLEDHSTFGQLRLEVTRVLEQAHVILVPVQSNQDRWIREILLDNAGSKPVLDLLLLAQLFLPGIVTLDLPSLYRTFMGKDLKGATLPGILDLSLEILARIMNDIQQDDRPFYTVLPALLEQVRNTEMGFIHRMLTHLGEYDLPGLDPLFRDRTCNPETIHELLLSADALLAPLWGSAKSGTGPAIPDEDESLDNISEDALEELFDSPELRRAIPGYRNRPVQVEYAGHVLNALENNGIIFLEAGTGTGKTQGYLIPAMAQLARNPSRRIILSTATKNLQNQIMERELPRLKSLFPDVETALLKGKANYPCLGALARAYTYWFSSAEADPEEIMAAREAWIYLVNLLHRAKSADLEQIPQRVYQVLSGLGALLEEVNAATHCTRESCRPDADLYGQVQQRAANAHLIVTNHHKLALLSEGLMETANGLIIDEADRFGDSVRSSLTTSFSSRRLARFLRRLVGNEHRRGYLQILENSLKKRTTRETPEEVLRAVGCTRDTAGSLLAQLDDAFETFSAALSIRHRSALVEDGTAQEVLIECVGSLSDGRELERVRKSLHGKLTVLVKLLGALASHTSLDERDRHRCETYGAIALRFVESSAELLAGFGGVDTAFALELMSPMHWEVKRIPVYLGRIIRDLLYTDSDRSILYTSATLYVNEELGHFRRAYGANGSFQGTVKGLRLSGTIDYAKQAVTVIDQSISPYRFNDEDAMAAWRQDIHKAIALYGAAANGRTLVLFTSYHDLDLAYLDLQSWFNALDIEILRQSGSSLEQIEQFRRNEFSILFGVDRFWSGVDLPGATLSQVLIVRAPNPSLADPVIKHRRLHERHFMEEEYGILGMLKLRQGVGRLLRSEADRGGIVILESRYAFSGNLRPHLTMLPGPSEAMSDQNRILTEVLRKARLLDEYRSRGIDLFQRMEDHLGLPKRVSKPDSGSTASRSRRIFRPVRREKVS